MFNVFRHAKVDYWPYQEPLNELLTFAVSEPEKVFAPNEEANNFLRHPQLEKVHFYEYERLAEIIPEFFRKEFVYDQYFSFTTLELQELKNYLKMLIDSAPARPVIQECRSAGRVEELKQILGGIHLFLWRNPWDQWWSYKLGFDVHNLLIANASYPPPFMERIKNELQIPEFHNSEIFCEHKFFNKRWLNARGSYMLFFALWCHAMLEAYPKCDLAINIDSLSKKTDYRKNINLQLDQMGIKGLDFSGCHVPQAIYGKSDQDFFDEIETQVVSIFLDSGYSNESIKGITRLRHLHQTSFSDSDQKNTVVRDALRARELARSFETEASSEMRSLREAKLKIDALNDELQSIYNSRFWRVTKAFRNLASFFKWLVGINKHLISIIIIKIISFALRTPRIKNNALLWISKWNRLLQYAQARGLVKIVNCGSKTFVRIVERIPEKIETKDEKRVYNSIIFQKRNRK